MDEIEKKSEDKPRLWTQIVATIITCISPVNVGYPFGLSSPAGIDLVKSVGLSDDHIGWFTSIVLIGAMAGSLIGVVLVDKLGRKMSLILLNIPLIVGWLLVVLAEVAQEQKIILGLLYSGRILQGVAVGITCAAQPLYVAEITTKQHRGRLGTLFQLSVNLGYLLAYVLGIPLYYRWMTLFPIGLSILMIALMFFLPESPRFLLKQGKKEKARKALRWLRGPCFDIHGELQQTQNILDAQVTLGRFHPREFLKPGLYRPFIIAVMVMIFVDASGITVVLSYSESIFESAGFEGKGDLASVILGIIFVLTVFPASFLTDRVGRKILLMISQFVMGLCLVTMGIYHYLSLVKNVGGLNWLSMGSLIVYVSAFSIGIGPISFVLVGELFPIRARGVCINICNLVHWIVAFATTKSFLHMIETLKEYGTFWLFAGFALLGLILTILLIPETKGKTLEEIEEHFCRNSLLSSGLHSTFRRRAQHGDEKEGQTSVLADPQKTETSI